ncbi:MAG: bifunctional phosphoribosyl-AMP cyclohydrolase/phosphoribosyl-ATP diphosphatase HisIE [Bacteroidetes bacterium]|nr:bifunctional phosphoribosyl-AMP cyclohydrolase/phosphoribosyl-ATP diphosphatase HisIE [Bacteroidota bacterium]
MIDILKINFDKLSGLVPAIIVDKNTDQVLMLGFMNKEAVEKTIELNKVTFFSRTKNRLWTKGETSQNYLILSEILMDCDNDSLLIYVLPEGNTCHLDQYSCFGIEKKVGVEFLDKLFNLIKTRKAELPENSYTTRLFNEGENRIIQKVGEEAIETVIAAKNRDKEEIINETSDLIYHLFVMLAEQDIEFDEIVNKLKLRHK